MSPQITIQFDEKHSKMIREMCGEYQSLTSFLSEMISKRYEKKNKGNNTQ